MQSAEFISHNAYYNISAVLGAQAVQFVSRADLVPKKDLVSEKNLYFQ